MAVKINSDLCIGCGLCPTIAPEVFEMKDGKAVVKANADEDKNKKEIAEAIESCPVEAISK